MPLRSPSERPEYEIHQGDKVLSVLVPLANSPQSVARMAARMGGNAVIRMGTTVIPIGPNGQLLMPRPQGMFNAG